MGTEASEYFSHHLGKPVRLLYIGGNGQREIPGAVFMPKHKYRALSIAVNDKLQPQRVRFADAAPLLITSSASEEDARQRLPPSARGEDLIVRFRPNIHIDVGGEVEPYDEDRWDLLTIRSKMDSAQEVSVRCLFRTVRCLSLNADLAKGSMITTNRQLYGLLAKDRRVNELFPREIIFIFIFVFTSFTFRTPKSKRAIERAKLTNVFSFIHSCRQARIWPICMCRPQRSSLASRRPRRSLWPRRPPHFTNECRLSHYSDYAGWQ